MENEDILQARCVKYYMESYFSKGFILFAVPNGEYRDKRTAGKLVTLGVMAGVADLIAVNPANGKLIGIELKTEIGVQSKFQKMFEDKLRKSNGEYYLVRNFEEFKKIIDNLFGIAK